MADRDLAKTIQQLKDALPKIQKKVEKFTEIADRLEDAFVTSATKDIYDKLMVKVAEREEQEEALQQLTEAILRIDQIFKGKRWTKEIKVIRKSYDLTRLKMTKNIDKIKAAIARVAKEKIPPHIQRYSKDMWSILDTYIGGSSSFGHDIAFIGKSTLFIHWRKVEGKVDQASKTIYIVLSQEFNNDIKKFGFMKMSVFPDRIEKPPFKEATWYIMNKRAMKGERVPPMAIGLHPSRDKVIGLFDYYGLSKIIIDRPKTNDFKATPKGIKGIREADWNLAMNDDPKKGPVIGKSPIAMFAVRAEHLEKYQGGELNGQVFRPKLDTILKDVMLLYPRRRGLQINVEELKKIDDPTKEEEYVYRLKVRFFQPGILNFVVKGK